jgi:DNA polymerase II large subunit
VTPCESIYGPIVKFSDGSVKKMHDYEETKKKYKEIQEILYLGDVLFPLGDVINRNAPLFSPGYVEEWWEEELKAAKGSVGNAREVDIQTAVTLSEEYSIPLHPSHIFFWTQISYDQFLRCIDWVQHAHIREGKLLLPYNATEKERFHLGKRALELLGVEHQVATEHVVLSKDITQAFLINLGFSLNHTNECIFSINFNEYDDVLKVINILSKVTIKDKAGEFMGSRMGRPEKAKLRKLIGSPNIIFPVGEEGGRFRSVNVALEGGTIKSDFPAYYCDMCKKETIYTLCEVCKKPARQEEEPFKKTRIDLKHYFEQARATLQLLKVHVPPLIKGVRGTSSEHHNIEPLEKGMLRAKYNLCVNKDGTIRYDCTEMPISHFKPKEIEVNIEKLIELGYSTDYQGKKLTTDTQILELKPHDIILPCNEYAGDEKADEVCMNICNFLDDLLEKLYKLPRYYNIKTRTDLVGQLGVCMAPHNCAGVICRIIGFSKVQGLLASPYMHAAMRRDCDGDEAAIMMLLDVLVNFSRKFLPSHRGGTQDAPLVLNGKIYANEVDDQILDFELVNSYPLELYQKAEQKKHSSEINIEMVKQRIARGEDPYVHTGFTHATENVNAGATCSSYKTLPTMKDKVEGQMVLCGKLRSVDEGDVARLIIDRHFMRDLKGNLRKFSQQTFRCVACNTIHRRPPLSGKCEKCKGKIIFTISYGSIVKYLEPALDLSTNFKVPEYIKQDLLLTKKYIESIFGKETEKQESIEKWF